MAPSIVFLVACAIAFVQWLLGFPLLGDGALLIGLYTVAAHESWIRARWPPPGCWRPGSSWPP